MILYHASDVGGITELRPQTAKHKDAYVYLSTKKELLFVYLVNPVKKFCLENNIEIESGHTCHRIAQRSWDQEKNCQLLYEQWPNAFEEIYKGTPSYFYEVEKNEDCHKLATPASYEESFYLCSKPIKVKAVEVIPDTYEYLKQMEKEGRVSLMKFENLTPELVQKIHDKAIKYYEEAKATGKTHFQKFVESKFGYVLNDEK